jgi:acetyl-CoA decarbonylase/synthase complex subunit delta
MVETEKKEEETEEEEGIQGIINQLTAMADELGEIELENVIIETDALEFEIISSLLGPRIQPSIPAVAPVTKAKVVPEVLVLPKQLLSATFMPPLTEWPGEVVEVQIGAKSGSGGSRKSVITIGGEKTMPFYLFEYENPNPPSIAIDVFDIPGDFLSAPVREKYEDVYEDPGEWAKKAVEYGANAVTIHLISTDPLINDTPVSEAARTVEEVLQAVDVPVIVGGSGDKDKDPLILAKAAEVAEGERVLLNSVSLDMDWKKVVDAAKKYGHNVIAFTQMNVNDARLLNTSLLKREMPKDQIVIDPTCAALGYGLEYAFSNYERVRLSALKGDAVLQMPMSAGTTNAWGAREANKSEKKMPQWGPRAFRGPLWETVTALTLALAGCDLFLMMHPGALQAFKSTVLNLLTLVTEQREQIDWIHAKF